MDVKCGYRQWWGLLSFIYHYGGGRSYFPYSDTENPYIRLYINVITSLYGRWLKNVNGLKIGERFYILKCH